MFQDIWLLMSIGIPALGLYYCLSARGRQDYDEASRLPFGDELNDAFTVDEKISAKVRAAKSGDDETLTA
ncbi:hypothetical protein [Pseudomonas sp. OIL-1]|uniref:hypothetical protein n=1 Tax=Pseudomonas sp. OIL-1 TaxID=2706126 RepID=UPI0013A754B7|nr:hypothetical protein [Pseudomonas sp. OIL-1]QIB50710.1 hypothetical protein G3M63_06335 [Pseudomonas sp. OIL-1]